MSLWTISIISADTCGLINPDGVTVCILCRAKGRTNEELRRTAGDILQALNAQVATKEKTATLEALPEVKNES